MRGGAGQVKLVNYKMVVLGKSSELCSGGVR
jgi:hypothetical protein